jgi:hypothetical protein
LRTPRIGCYKPINLAPEPNVELPADGLFPATRRDWLATQSSAGQDGRREVNGFVMALYAPALEAYLRGSSYRSLGEPGDLVAGFFASRLDRMDFFSRWLASDLPFRRWIVNAFLFFLQEESRRRRTRAGVSFDEEPPPPTAEPDAVERFETAWARSIIRAACERAYAMCEAAGQIAESVGIDAARAPGMVRTASGILRRALLEALVRDGGGGPELDEEVRRLLAALAGSQRTTARQPHPSGEWRRAGFGESD